MILTCNSCGKKFVVPDSAITSSGRMVQCGSCGNKWKQFPINEQKIVSSSNIPRPSKTKVSNTKKVRKNTIKKYSKYNIQKKSISYLRNISQVNNFCQKC